MEPSLLKANLTVAEILARWPSAIDIFFRHHMACPGCTMAPFDTLADVSATYGLQLDHFQEEMEQYLFNKGG
jgi:hybrid cluster-associated redox disulfide protein